MLSSQVCVCVCVIFLDKIHSDAVLRFVKGYLDVGLDDEMKADPGGEREPAGRRHIRAEEPVESDTLWFLPPLMRSVKTPLWNWENISDEGALTSITVNTFRPPLHLLPHSSSATRRPARPGSPRSCRFSPRQEQEDHIRRFN